MRYIFLKYKIMEPEPNSSTKNLVKFFLLKPLKCIPVASINLITCPIQRNARGNFSESTLDALIRMFDHKGE